jgi:serine/threonine-protein kinase
MGDGVPFGRYRLVKKLGAGGMAEVFLALDGDRRVALKRILPMLSKQRDYQLRFLDEARLGALLSHPFLAQVLEVGQLEGDLYLTMEHVNGVNLSQLIERAAVRLPQFPWPVALRICACAAEALQYAHELRGPDGRPLQLLHRDVSPSNVMVGYQGAVKVVDLGVARTPRSAEPKPGVVFAKVEYVAPEQLRGEPLDARVDVYGLGVTLYELLTGALPLRKAAAADTAHAVMSEALPALKASRRDVPSRVGKLLSAATAKSPKDRPADMRALRQGLEECLREQDAAVGLPEIADAMATVFPSESRLQAPPPPPKGTARLLDEDDAPTERELTGR